MNQMVISVSGSICHPQNGRALTVMTRIPSCVSMKRWFWSRRWRHGKKHCCTVEICTVLGTTTSITTLPACQNLIPLCGTKRKQGRMSLMRFDVTCYFKDCTLICFLAKSIMRRLILCGKYEAAASRWLAYLFMPMTPQFRSKQKPKNKQLLILKRLHILTNWLWLSK